jgi:secernin
MCDTFVALGSATSDGSVIFGKNSDREPNEAQILEYHPAASHPDGSLALCTYIEIPQVKDTLAVLISRPFWMYGAEIGANEKGVVIGNEAVFTKMPYRKQGGLLGMDILRLALERASTAEQAVETMVGLLADHGQGGPCGYEDKKMTYHNSYLVADPTGAWVLETADYLWAAKKVESFYAISNGLTIGNEFDRYHPDLIDTARQKGWIKKGEDFHFADAFSDWFFTTFSACRRRRSRAERLIFENQPLDIQGALSILRDHGEDSYKPDSHMLISRMCAHAAYPISRNAAQTTGSMAAHLKPEAATFFATGTSAPCLSSFKPIRFEGPVLPDIGPGPQGTFDPNSLWWRHERLHRTVLKDYANRRKTIASERDSMEAGWLEEVNRNDADFFKLTQHAFDQEKEAESRWLEAVASQRIENPPNPLYRWYWRGQNRKAGIPDA